MKSIVLLATLDTKAAETAYVRRVLEDAGESVTLVDTGVLGSPGIPAEIRRDEVARAAGADVEALAAAGDRGAAITQMAAGAAKVVEGLWREGRLRGALALGGTGGTSIACHAFRELPLGVPKVVVSTAASGDTRPYVGSSDLILMPSVVDIAGLNRVSRPILRNAANAVAGMVLARESRDEVPDAPLVGATMFGVTTPAVEHARVELEAAGLEVLTFHMTGTGGMTLEWMLGKRMLSGVLDLTTTELADELVGGVFSAGPGRLTAAARHRIPQVVAPGALDMVNFGPMETVPREVRNRNLYVHNPSVTLMRTTPEECAELGRRLVARIGPAGDTATIFIPLQGVSAISCAGGHFYDKSADDALFGAIREGARSSSIEVVEMDTHINDPAFSSTMVAHLITKMNTTA